MIYKSNLVISFYIYILDKMSFSGLLNSLWNSKSAVNKNNINNNPPIVRGTRGQEKAQDIYSQTNIKTSVPISQGKEYILYKQSKVNNVNNEINNFNVNRNQHSISNYGDSREGFSGMIGPSQVNTKNQADISNLQTMEDEFNRTISSYASSQRNLMDKSQQFLQGKRTYSKNIHAIQAANTDEIIPNWVGCYKPGNDGLIEQTDLGNNTNITDCKVRASDLGYSTFALRQKVVSPGNTCFVGDNIDKAQSGGLATKPVISYAFSKSEGANIGGLLMNGQIGVYEDDITTNLVTDLKAVENCDISIGGQINANTTVATYGYNCNGTEKSKFTPPPPQPKTETPIPAGYKKYNAADGTNNLMQLNTTDINKLAEVCNKNNNCLGFNNVGYLKKSSTIEKSNKIRNGVPVDLYMKTPSKNINIDTSKQYRLQNVNSTNCLYNNSDGRFGTYTCMDFNDQYWTLSEVPGQVNTYMFKGVNSYYSLYADTNGNFRTAISDINNPTQQWELVPISGQTDTYQLKNKKTSSCLYNNADGRFNMSNCVAAYNDQWWKLIPITEGPKKCDQYGDNDTNLPDECYAQMWKEAGCTAPVINNQWWRAQTKAVAKNDIYLWSTMTDDVHRNACYAPVPVVKTGSTINTGSLWKNPWVRINDGTNAFSIGQINDGSIICANSGGITYTRANLSVPWKSYPTNIPIKSYIQLQDGRYLGVGKNDNSLYIKNNLNEKWNGFNINLNSSNNEVTEQTVFSNNGTVSCDTYCQGIGGYSWNRELPESWRGAVCVGSNLENNSCSKVRGFGTGLQCKCQRADNKPYAGTTANTVHVDIPDPNTCCVLSIVQLNNGTLIGVGTNNYLYRRETINDTKWKQIKCPSSCCVTSISKLSDGSTMVAVGTNGYIYTRVDGEEWILVDQSMQMSAVTQLKDGTILGLDLNGNFFKK